MIKKLLKYFLFFFFNPIWYLQLLIPRNKKNWIFGAWFGERYADNSRALFEYVSIQKGYKAIWLTHKDEIRNDLKSKGYNSFKINSLKGILYSLTAKYVIVSVGKGDVNQYFINGSISVQLWHGVPMKKIFNDDKFSKLTKKKIFIFKYFLPVIYEFNYNYYVSTSEIFNKKIQSAFIADENQIIHSGYPRNDVLFSDIHEPYIAKLRKKFPDAKIITYLPTHRGETAKDFDYFTDYGFDLEKFNSFLEKENLLFIYKGHFYVKSENKNLHNRVIQITNSDIEEVNVFLKDIDILVTDYSGAYFDFLLTGKPIIFAPFDLEIYISTNRELYFDYNDILCGSAAQNWDEIILSLQELLKEDKYSEIRKKKNILFNSYNKQNNSKVVFDFLINKRQEN